MLRYVLPSIRVPTLVLHRTDDACLPAGGGRYVASLIPGAKYVELEGRDHLFFVGDQDAILCEIEEFLTGARDPLSDCGLAPDFTRANATCSAKV
jgi:pimeloyl-ACP methyl ester carboxylesterase